VTATAAPDLDAVEARLAAVLDPYRDRLEPVEVYGQPFLRRPGANKHQWFAGVNRGNGVVRFSLLPMHQQPDLLEGVTAGLRKRKTGASLFTFATIDAAQLAELEALVAQAWDVYAAERT